mmetsp:Transcript_2079/g.4049  ORF Transcript_2079/g.4049 Transcript_2079/m.4049 type:complete len:463 (+) Transcript_2079:89-1477(+)|eukprot:scaffold6072_cov94-Amphora_coffeaeformis.AAC.5
MTNELTSSSHHRAADKTRNSLARIEAMIAKTTAASRKYMPSWEKKLKRPSISKTATTTTSSSSSSSSTNTKSKAPSSSSSHHRRRSSATPKCTPKQVETPQSKAPQKSTWQIHSKTEWSPLPPNPKLSGKSHTQQNSSFSLFPNNIKDNEKTKVNSPLSSSTHSENEFLVVVQTATRVPSSSSNKKETKRETQTLPKATTKSSKKTKDNKSGNNKKKHKKHSKKERRDSVASNSENFEFDFSEVDLEDPETTELCFFTEADGGAWAGQSSSALTHVFEDASFPSFLDFEDKNSSNHVPSTTGVDSLLKGFPHNKDTTESTELMDETSSGSNSSWGVTPLQEFAPEAQPLTCQQEVANEPQDTELIMRILILTNSMTSDKSVTRNALKASAILDYVGVENLTIDGADPQHGHTRNDLCELSERWAEYPQFFHVVGDEACFLGGMAEFTAAVNENRFGEWLVDL